MQHLSAFRKATFAILIIFVVSMSYYFYATFYKEILVKTPTEIRITDGQPILRIAYELHKQGVLPHPRSFVFFTKLYGQTRKVHAGEYLLTPRMTPQKLLKLLVEGRVIMREFTIIEGWTLSQILKGLRENPYFTHDVSLHSELTPIPEGRLFPETYYFARDTKESEILAKANQLMESHLTIEWNTRDPLVPYQSANEALIVASLIEKESAIQSERPKIAGVIISRLEKKMPLQIDPTVIYGLGDRYHGKLTKELLKEHNLYNTYLNKGLPPTPIAMPSLSSIRAALHPDKDGALYFVAKGDGTHVFSNTLKEHNEAVKALKLKLQQAKG